MRRTLFCFAAAAVLVATAVLGQQYALRLTATSINVSEPGQAVRLDIARWSSDKERNDLATALTPPAPAPTPPPVPTAAPAAAEAPEGAAGATAARGGRGQAGRGGAAGGRGAAARGGRGGGNASPADPISAFTSAIGRAPTIGYIWTNEITGYSIKYAVRSTAPDGGESIILATNRRMGANTPAWAPAGGTPNTYEFTLLEIHLPRSGSGEAKASLTSNISLDNENKTIRLQDYAAAPALLANVKRQ